MEKNIERLKQLYIKRVETEQCLNICLRYDTSDDIISGLIKSLNELRIRINELERFLTQEVINIIKVENNVDLW